MHVCVCVEIEVLFNDMCLNILFLFIKEDCLVIDHYNKLIGVKKAMGFYI